MLRKVSICFFYNLFQQTHPSVQHMQHSSHRADVFTFQIVKLEQFESFSVITEKRRLKLVNVLTNLFLQKLLKYL